MCTGEHGVVLITIGSVVERLGHYAVEATTRRRWTEAPRCGQQLGKNMEPTWLRRMVFHIPDDMLNRGCMRQTVMHHLPMHTTTVQHIIRISHSSGARRSHPGYFAVWMWDMDGDRCWLAAADV